MSTSYARAVSEAMRGEPVMLVAAGVAVLQGDDILLLQRPDHTWDLPGGHLEPGESLEETATRETLEETGLSVSSLTLLGIASGSDSFIARRNAYYVTAIYIAGRYSGVLLTSNEHLAARFFPLCDLPIKLAPAAQRVTAKLREEVSKAL